MPARLASAEWEEQPVVAERYAFTDGKFWLGRAQDATAIGYRDDRHICLVSGTRGGKGASIICNNLCFWPGSAVVCDPKGENATVTAARRGKGSEHCVGMGQAVHVLDPFREARGIDERYFSCFNPLADLDPQREETIDEATRLANTIVVVKDDAHDPFWDEAARTMLRGLILYVLTARHFTKAERNLVTVRQLIVRGDWQIAETIRAQGHSEDKIDNPHMLLWRAMERTPAFNGLVAGAGARFRAMMASSEKTFDGILNSVNQHTEFIDSPGMQRVLAKSDFKLSELKTRPEGMTLYLSLPQRYMDTHYRWLRMMVALTTTEMEITRGQPATGYPVLMVLDEFAGLKRMAAIETAIAQIAGFGVKILFVVQSLEQLKHTYKDNWETFLSNAGLKIFFSIEDHFTREYVSKLVGETEIVRELKSSNKSYSENESTSDGTSESKTTSSSTTSGTSTSHTRGKSWSKNFGTSSSVNVSENVGVNRSISLGETFGTNESFGWSSGKSSGTSRTTQSGRDSNGTGVNIPNHTFSEGENSSISGSRGTNQSKSRNTTEGTSRGSSRGFSTSENRGRSYGGSDSDTFGRSHSETYGTSDTTGTSHSYTRGSSHSSGTGSSESVHHRPLIQPDEIGRIFGRIDDPNHDFYPGLALVLVTGGNPFVLTRKNYFQDPQFIDCFSPHPDHSFRPAIAASFGDDVQPLIEKIERAANGKPLSISRWFIEDGKLAKPGHAAAMIEQVAPDNRTVYIQVPQYGKIAATGATQENRLPSGDYEIPSGNWFTIKSYDGEASAIDPFQELRAACHDLDKLRRQTEAKKASPAKAAATPRTISKAMASVLIAGMILVVIGGLSVSKSCDDKAEEARQKEAEKNSHISFDPNFDPFKKKQAPPQVKPSIEPTGKIPPKQKSQPQKVRLAPDESQVRHPPPDGRPVEMILAEGNEQAIYGICQDFEFGKTDAIEIKYAIECYRKIANSSNPEISKNAREGLARLGVPVQ